PAPPPLPPLPPTPPPPPLASPFSQPPASITGRPSHGGERPPDFRPRRAEPEPDLEPERAAYPQTAPPPRLPPSPPTRDLRPGLPRHAGLRPPGRGPWPFIIALIVVAGLTVTIALVWRAYHRQPKRTEVVLGGPPLTLTMTTESLETQRLRRALKACRCDEARRLAEVNTGLSMTLRREVDGCPKACEGRRPSPP
ncbi:hypothetical protein KKB55_00765, partial [Myxococcota bacterium]|nr:hypothetical protein [Myxococcota bacterium]MBU1896283.1 hypothetical protein [Myxococcota bacterium]